jgi:hypothetical protein
MELCPVFCSTFIGSTLIFVSLTHFEFIFIWCEMKDSYHSSACGYPLVSTQFIEETVLSPLYVLEPFVKSQLPKPGAVSQY